MLCLKRGRSTSLIIFQFSTIFVLISYPKKDTGIINFVQFDILIGKHLNKFGINVKRLFNLSTIKQKITDAFARVKILLFDLWKRQSFPCSCKNQCARLFRY